MSDDTEEIKTLQRNFLTLQRAAEQASLKLVACSGPHQAFQAQQLLDSALSRWPSAEQLSEEWGVAGEPPTKEDP